MELLILIYTLIWSLFLYFTWKGQKFLRSLNETSLIQGPEKISIVIAVKDQQKDIENTLNRLGGLNEVHEIIVVNDRSKDGTKKIIEDKMASITKIRLINIESLPEGWLGKVHALHQGSMTATGDFLLFMDADIQISDEVLLKAKSVCSEKQLDHLGVLPKTKRGDFMLNLMMSTSKLLFTMSAKTWKDQRPVESVKGVGAFNFVRREKFLTTQGFEWLKMDVADDVALAQLIAKNGGRSMLMKACESGPKLDWYRNFDELVRGLEKNVVGGFTNYRLSLVVIVSAMALVPVFGFLFAAVSPVGILPLIATVIFASKAKKYTDHSWFELFCFPLGIALLSLILIRSSIICFRQGGIWWSGTFYKIEDLKRGSRVKLGL